MSDPLKINLSELFVIRDTAPAPQFWFCYLRMRTAAPDTGSGIRAGFRQSAFGHPAFCYQVVTAFGVSSAHRWIGAGAG
jgi:hypothetical protein